MSAPLAARLLGTWRAWVTLCDRREPALGLAAFRAASGAVLLFTLTLPLLAGTVEAIWVDAAHGGLLPDHHGFWLDLLGGATPNVVWSLFGGAYFFGLCTLLGAFGRVAPLLALQCYAALYPTSINASSDSLLANGLWLCVLADCTATLSLDARLRHGSWLRDAVQIPAWPRYLGAFQIIAVYTYTGLQKVGEGWGHSGDYAALYYVLQRPNWQRIEMAFLTPFYPITQLMTVFTVYWEMAAPLLLLFFYYRYTPERPGRLRALCLRHDLRAWFLAFGVLLHAGIALTMEVGPFSYVTVSFYLCCLHPDELVGLARRLTKAVVRPRATHPAAAP
jgi:hypothetical protein